MNTASPRRSPLRARLLAGSVLLAAIGAVAAVPITGPAASAATLSHASPVSAVSAAQPGQSASGGPSGRVVSWSVAPATAKAADSRTRFTYQNIKPGSTIFDHVAVFNRSSQAVAFLIYATDATGTSAANALTLLPANARPKDIGSWTTFPGHGKQLSIIIPGKKGIIVPFNVTVPLRATPGDHVGGMIAAVGVPHRTASGELVTLYERIAVPMELRVTGKLVAALTVKSVSIGYGTQFNPFGGGPAHVTYSVTNTGNVLLAGIQTVTVTGPFGAKSSVKVPKLPTVLPGDSIQYTVSSGGMYPAGSIAAHVTVTPKWPSDATPLAVTLASASASGSLFAFPWALLVLIILLGGGGYGGLRLMRSRRRAHEAEIAAAADKARRETERRLLGGANAKASAKPAAGGKSSAKPAPAASGKPPATPAANAGASATPAANGSASAKPAANANGSSSAKPAANGSSSATPAANGNASAKPAASGNGRSSTKPAAEPAAGPAATPAVDSAVTPAAETAVTPPAKPAAKTTVVKRPAAKPAAEAAVTTPTGAASDAGKTE